MYTLAEELYLIPRSLTGEGVRTTLQKLKERFPLTIHEVPTGTSVFDWTVPPEWRIREARLIDPSGAIIADYAKNPLHIVGYSVPVEGTFSRGELEGHLYSSEEQPSAIPYITSYYKERWGFCLPHAVRSKLSEGMYTVRIDSELVQGSLTYGELIIPGREESEILLSTYVCHPNLANDNLSGMVLATQLAEWLLSAPRRYTYRIVFIPETIGSLVYLSRHLEEMQKKTVAGFVLTCVGDSRGFSFVPTPSGTTLADRVARHVLSQRAPNYREYSFLQRGSDERQYCAPGVDLPVVSVMRSKYYEYPEYHTSLDDLSLISPDGLKGSFDVLSECIEVLESNAIYKAAVFGEPQLGPRGLYPDAHFRRESPDIVDVFALADGTRDLVAIADAINRPAKDTALLAQQLEHGGLLTRV